MAQVPSASKNKAENMANDTASALGAGSSASGTSSTMGASSTDSGATTGDVQADLEALRRDIASLTQTVASFGSGKIRQASETSQQYMDSARERFMNAEEDIEAYVRAKPLQSLAMAAGIGYVLALLSRR
jgi:ElaB/YqjD/DUF883 family membrane-anchored ribosome-binding protein